MNKDFPQVGAYGWFNHPWFDRIKREHPQFSQTLATLKLPAPLEEVKLIKW